MTKEQKLELLWTAIRKAYPKRALVFSDGDPDAQIMIIGEAPGMDEERQGKPFVGRAGKLLETTLIALGWKRNRTPTDEEIAKFRPAIEKEIAVVAPKLIVLVGRVAMAGMGLEGTMAENRGRVLEKDGRRFLITYHPAAILRNPNWEPLFREDLARIRETI